MTIVACVKVYDGIVLGADSATQIMGNNPQGDIVVLKTFQNAKKLFQLQGLPVGILTYGIGNIENKSIETLLRDFDRDNLFAIDSGYNIESITKELFNFFKDAYDQKFGDIAEEGKKPILGFYIAGYSDLPTEGEEWEFVLPVHTEPKRVREPDKFGSSWRGISIPFTRLYFGYDPRAMKDFIDAGFNENVVKQIYDKYKSAVSYAGMPVKDAVEFVKFILRTTIGLSSFEIGSPSCSEPINIAIISPNEGFNLEENI